MSPVQAGSSWPAEKEIKQGLDALFHLDFPTGQAAFEKVITEHPQEALGYLGQAIAFWWQSAVELQEQPGQKDKNFLKSLDQTIAASKAMIARGDASGHGHLCLGASYGLRGRKEAAQKQYLKAYLDGKRAYHYQKQALKINPELYDANLGLGIYNYYVATLPKVLRVIAFLKDGDRQKGLAQLKLASEKGTVTPTAAKLFLLAIYLGPEKKPQEALAVATQLRQRYPQSPLMHLLLLFCLHDAGETQQLAETAQDYTAKIEQGAPYYKKEDLAKGFFFQAMARCKSGAWPEALPFFDQALDHVSPRDPWISWIYLWRGQTHDILGQRELACRDYHAVLKSPKLWNIQDQAKANLKKPYKKK